MGIACMANVRQFAVLFSLPWIVGCASLDTAKMVAIRESFGITHKQKVAVCVTGGSPGVRAYSKTIKPEDFQEAIRISIEKSGLFQTVVERDKADYILQIRLIYASSHPGLTMNAWVSAKWSLLKKGADDRVWSADIVGKGVATVWEAFNGLTRQYMAMERAAKQNIDQALMQLGQLRLDAV